MCWFLLPFFLMIGIYVVIDPYKKIWHHSVYLCDYIMLNRGDVSTHVYLYNRHLYKFNSFIFGSSRSTAFTSSSWSNYLHSPNVPFSYGSWNESVEGIYNKMALIDSLNDKLDNAIVIFDVDKTFADQSSYNPISNDHYLIAKKSIFDYQLSGIVNYYEDPLTVITSIDFSLFHKRRKYMTKFIGMKAGDLNPINNDWLPNSEKQILSDSVSYYNHTILKKFYNRSTIQRYAPKQITRQQEFFLMKIKGIFTKKHTRYKIIISPLYDQLKFNPVDFTLLTRIFGSENIYDYSGINSKTNNIYNYNNDVIHFRKKLANTIFHEIYTK